jgi:hypothetical protein
VGALAVTAACAHDPITTNLTWTGEISRVVYKHCANCHHPGGRAFSLLSYEDARPWAKAMRDEVLARRMPPWGPVKGVGEFRDDPSLSQPEIDLLVSWVEGGAPEGDPVYLPALPHFDAAPAPGSLPRPTAPPRTLASDTAWTLDRPFSLLSVRPLRLAEGGSLELMAVCPDGSVKHLIWIRGYRREWQRTYVFQEPVRLPLGTRLSVRSSMPSAVAIATAKPER